jgi:parallel beta-helix repeat protein
MPGRRSLRLLVFVCLAFAGFASPARATDIYVAPTGSDSAAGSITDPLATPAEGLRRAAAGDTVYLRHGTYKLSATLEVRSANVRLTSYPGEWAAIVAPTTDVNVPNVLMVYASGVTIDHVEIQGGYYYGIKLDDLYGPQTAQHIASVYIHHTGRDAVKAQNSDGLVIENSEMAFTGLRDNTNADGIDVMGSQGVTIRGNYVHDTATTGIYIKAGTSNGLIERNRVENAGYSGILLGSESDAQFMRNGTPYEAIDSVARNNVIVGTGYTGLGSISGYNVRFQHNTVINAARIGQAAFRVAPNAYNTAARQVLLQNNVFTLDPGSARPMVQLIQYTDALTCDYNIWFHAAGRYQYWRETSTGNTYWSSFPAWQLGMGVDQHSVAADPLLDGAALYLPRSGSPAIDTGMTTAGVPADYSGTSRPQGAAYDIGAHERVFAPLGAPTNLSAAAVSSSAIALSWQDNSSAEDGFTIERSTDGVLFSTLAVVAANAGTFSDSSAVASTTYWYRVSAFGAMGTSASSNVASATTPPAPPAAPSSLAAKAISTSQVALTWTDHAVNEGGFTIQRSSDGVTFSTIANVAANASSYTDGGLQRKKTYFYRVAAHNAGGTSAWSNTATATVPHK